jgi:sulfur carrier protein
MPTASAGLTITVNGDSLSVAVGTTALEVVESLGLAGRPIAVEVNEAVVPRARLAGWMLEDGARLEIVTLVGGG